jgi:hypothetical protein
MVRLCSPPKTAREALLSMLKSYEKEVRSGRHVPPPLPIEERPASQFADPVASRT